MAPIPLADDARVIYSVYAAAFIPLAFIYGLDFITTEWKTIRETRRHGIFQLFLSLPSLGYVIYYVFLQVHVGVHREAASAVTVAVVNTYHVCRTIWGLIQLYEFRNWNIHALSCLIKLGYTAPYTSEKDWTTQAQKLFYRARDRCIFWRSASCETVDTEEADTESSQSDPVADINAFTKCINFFKSSVGVSQSIPDTDETLDLSNNTFENVKRTVDYHMVVNNSLIDNEFANTTLPVHPVLSARVHYTEIERRSSIARLVASFFRSASPEECSVRWLASFLANFGSKWLADTRRLSEEIESVIRIETIRWRTSQDLSVLAAFHTTQGLVSESGSTESFISLFSPFHQFCIDPRRARDSIFDISKLNALPFKMKGYENDVFDFFNQETTMKDAMKDDFHKAALNRLNDNERSAVENVSAAQLACFSKLMEQDHMFNDELGRGFRGKDDDPRVRTLIYQLGYNVEKDYSKFLQELPLRKQSFALLLWYDGPNRRLFQASVHIDNHISFENGNRLVAYLEGFKQTGEQARADSVFQRQYDLETSGLQFAALTSREVQTARFIGCAVETVRSTLAEWILNNKNSTDGWEAIVSLVEMSFVCSEQLCFAFAETKSELFNQSRHMRLVWEVQSFLQWKMRKDIYDEGEDPRTSQSLIMLFLLGFPSLQVKPTEEELPSLDEEAEHNVITFQKRFILTPVGGPQESKITVDLNVESRKVALQLELDESIFDWQAWKDAFMGRMSAQKEWRQTRLSSQKENLREEANNSKIATAVRQFSEEVHGKDCDLRYWAGWPPFMPQIAQFESKKADWEYYYTVDILNPALDKHFHSGEVLGSTYNDGCQALKEGKDKEAFDIFGRCIAERGNRDALKEFARAVFKNVPPSTERTYALGKHMSSWFTVLINRNSSGSSSQDSEIDFDILADYGGRLSEATGITEFGHLKALSLFHQGCPNRIVSARAIHAMESMLCCEELSVDGTILKIHLAIAHQSLFVESNDPIHKHLAETSVLQAGLFPPGPQSLSIGYLLEKGFYTRRDKKHKSRLLTFCANTGYCGDGKRLEAFLDQLFVKQDCADHETKGGDDEQGIGEHPRHAIAVYETMVMMDIDSGAALNRIGLLYHRGARDVDKNESEAEDQYSQAIEKGCQEALCNLGVLKNGNEAEGHDISFLRAASVSNSTAMNNLAVALELGNGITHDSWAAEMLYKQAIDEVNHPIAMYNLAMMYKFGDSKSRSVEKAERWMEEVISLSTDISGLSVLQKEISKVKHATKLDGNESTDWQFELEEFEGCLAYLKVRHKGGTIVENSGD